ncbi:hypothetical protein K466DRAFT_606075 [Polyporus arcularius HHB13444]|uniref:Uncharacterized protein n=1 Tax=Polyporus arcularius HHB13444 TaxID=1314778 RepID=A0A5C3NQK4_9APHY|nr:hypothetical protein K466DRAFT_606075 [Polyporus arcularius HHB13444]
MKAVTPHIYLLPDARIKHYSTPEDIRHIVLFVNGPTAVLTFVLPICDLQEPGAVAPKQFDDYLADVQGNALTRCEVSVAQRQLLRDIFVAYRAFYAGEVDPVHAPYAYPLFISLLLDVATSLEDHEPADDVLVEIVVWLRQIFPEELFGHNVPVVGHDDPTPLNDSGENVQPLEHPPTSSTSPAVHIDSGPLVGDPGAVASSIIKSTNAGPGCTAAEAELEETTVPAPAEKPEPSEALNAHPHGPTITTTPIPTAPVPERVPSNDAALHTLFPGGVPVGLLNAVLAADSCDATPWSPQSSTTPPHNDNRDHRPEDGLTTAQRNSYVRMLLSGEGDDFFPDGVPLQLIHDLLLAGPAASRARRARAPIPLPTAAVADLEELPHCAVPASTAAAGASAPDAPVLEEGGYESDGSMPSLRTVSDSSDSEDEQYVDDDDDYYDHADYDDL